MADFRSATSYPLPTRSSLLAQYLDQPLSSLPTPAAVIDRAVVRRNCDAMLGVSRVLGLGFRAHVKSHKTLELSKLQVGDTGPADFIVSTIIEAENLIPFLQECQGQGRACSILYGVPIPQSAIPRLVHLSSQLQPGTLSILIDNIESFTKFYSQIKTTPAQIGIYIKVDTGYQRAGIKTSSPAFPSLVHSIVSQAGSSFRGFYSHYGHSYAGSSEDDAANGLLDELLGLEEATREIPSSFQGEIVLTVGATPTATAAQNMLSSSTPKSTQVKHLIEKLKTKYKVELHAGVYPLLDLQQVATHARPAAISISDSDAAAATTATTSFQPLSKENIGLKMLVEITSTYSERDKPEALISAGSLALGREPCKSYPGWGILTPDLGNSAKNTVYNERETDERTGWIVGRISQEHGILTWEGDGAKASLLTIGDKVMVWPNHACVAGAGFGWYVVVDSEVGGDRVVDVWVRWRGW